MVEIFLEVELGLAEEGRFGDLGVQDEVIIDYAVFVDNSAVTFVGETDQEDVVLSQFEGIVDGCFYLAHVVISDQLVLEPILFVGALRLGSSMEHSDIDFFVVSLFAPDDHGVVVSFEDEHISGPLIVYGFVLAYWLCITLHWILVVCQKQSMIVVFAFLLNADSHSLAEAVDL